MLQKTFFSFVYCQTNRDQIKERTLPKGTQDAVVPAQVCHASAEGRNGHLHLGKVCSQSQLAPLPQRSDQAGVTHKQLHAATGHH